MRKQNYTVIKNQSSDTIEITFGLNKSINELGNDETRDNVIDEKIIELTNDKINVEKLVFNSIDTKNAYFYFFSTTYTTEFNVSKEEKDFFYNSQFVIDVFDTNDTSKNVKIDTLYVTLQKFKSYNQSYISITKLLPYLFISQNYKNEVLYLRFTFYNSKTDKRYIFKTDTNELTDNNLYVPVRLDLTNNTYFIDKTTLNLYQAVVINKYGLPDNMSDDNIIQVDTPTQTKELDLDNTLNTLLNNGSIIKEEDGTFYNILADIEQGDNDDTIPSLWTDFYNMSYPVVEVRLIGVKNPNTDLFEAIPRANGNLYINDTYGYTNLSGLKVFSFAVKIFYYNYNRCVSYPAPQIFQEIIYSIDFDPVFCDYEQTGTEIIGLSAVVAINYEDILLNPNSEITAIFNLKEVNPPARTGRRDGYFEFGFSGDRTDFNVIYTDENANIILASNNEINQQSNTNNTKPYFTNPGEEGIGYSCSITTAGIIEPAEVLRIKKNV